MKRVLSLVLALVMVLGMIPTFAAEMTGGEHLLDHGFITGKPGDDVATKLDAGAALTRQELAALIAELMGEKEIAAVFAQPADYADADKIGAWAVPFVAYAQVNGWMSGKPGNMFDPTGPVPGQQLAAVLMNALGYTVDTEAKYATVIADAAALGLVVPSGNLTRGQAFESMWVAVSEVNVNGEEQTLGVKLGKLDPPAPVVTDLAVESVSASNLREVFVVFNNEIDEDTLDKANFMIGTTTATSVTLQEDGMTVVAWFELANQSTYTLKISEIADVNGSEVKDFSQQFTVNDFTAPTVVGVEVVGNKKLIVTFSEPVTPATAQILSNYKINDLLFGAAVTVDGREVSLVLTNRLADGVHKLTVSSNVKDYANFLVVANNTEFAVAKDETKAALATVDSASQTKVVITLTKPVEGTFTVSATSGSFVSKTSKDNQTWTLTFLKATPLPLSGTEIKLTDVVDYYGNKGDITFNVIPTIDLVRPEVVAVTPKSQTTMEVEFTKAVMLPANSAFTIKTTATTPVTVPVTAVAYAKDADNEDILTKLVITGAFAAKEYTIEIAGVIDNSVQANVMIPYASKVTVADLTKPTITGVELTPPTTTTAGAFYVYFSEKVDVATATNKANYSYIMDSVKPVSLGDAHTITVLPDGMTVKIVVPKLGTGETAITSLTVINVTDVAGNKMLSTVEQAAFPGLSSVTPVISNARATALNKIVVDVTANINPASVTASDFVVVEAGQTTAAVYVINAEYDADDNEITLTLSNNLTTAALYDGNSVNVSVVAQNLSNIFGTQVALNAAGIAVADEIAPTATKVASAVGTNATTTTIKVNLSEALASTALDQTYMVVKLDGTLYLAADYTVGYAVDGTEGPQLTFTVTTTADLTGKSYSIEYYKHAGTADGATVPNPLASFTFTGTLQ